tara:strand:- start:2351 stop:3271 length:921 start_codon:yes stop_codon:yes gene_type:complete
MKTVLTIIFILLISNVSKSMEIKIIHKIQNEIITNVDIKNEMKYLLTFNKNLKKLNKERIFNISNESLIRETIKEIEIKKRFSKGTNIRDGYLSEIIKSTYSNLGLNSIEEFEAYLKKNNLDMVTIKKKLTLEALWNQLIYKKYKNQITINKNEILKKISNNGDNITKEYQLSEIVFEVKNKEEISNKYNEIVKSIKEIGFQNSASVYSFSESSKTGGKIGWINENSLIDIIKKNIIDLNINEISKPIIVSNGILILKVIDTRETEVEIDIEVELKKAIAYENNRQLKQYSNIYFNKIKKNLEFNE